MKLLRHPILVFLFLFLGFFGHPKAFGQAVATIGGHDFPQNQFRLEHPHPPICTIDHYHAASGATVTALDGSQLTDPGGCGFGMLTFHPLGQSNTSSGQLALTFPNESSVSDFDMLIAAAYSGFFGERWVKGGRWGAGEFVEDVVKVVGDLEGGQSVVEVVGDLGGGQPAPSSPQAPVNVPQAMSQPEQAPMYSPNVIQQCALDSRDSYLMMAAHTRTVAKGWHDLAKGRREDAKKDHQRAEEARKNGREDWAKDWDEQEKTDKERADDFDRYGNHADENAKDDEQKADDAQKRADKAAEDERQRKAEADRLEQERADNARKAADEKARAEQADRDARKAQAEKDAREKADKADADRRAARQEAERQAREQLENDERQRQADIDARKAAFEASGKLAESTGGRGGSTQGKKGEVSGTGETFATEGAKAAFQGGLKIGTHNMDKGIGGALEGAVDGAFTAKDVVDFGKAANEVVNRGAAQRQEVSDRIDQLSDPNYRMKSSDASSGSVYGSQFKQNAATLISAAPIPKF